MLDFKITKELLEKPECSNSQLARKLRIPLSTIRRRKTHLEGSVLTRKYQLNTYELGWRTAEILLLVENGTADRLAQELLEKFDKILGTSVRINTKTNLALYVGFRYSEELHDLMEKLRATPNINNLEWSEIVREDGNKDRRMAYLIFNSSQQRKLN